MHDIIKIADYITAENPEAFKHFRDNEEPAYRDNVLAHPRSENLFSIGDWDDLNDPPESIRPIYEECGKAGCSYIRFIY